MFAIFFIGHNNGGIDCSVKLENYSKDAYNSSPLVEIAENISNLDYINSKSNFENFILFLNKLTYT